MSEYEFEQPTHDEPTADYPPADQYDNLIGQPLDGGFAEPHEQSVGGFTANDGYGADTANYGDQGEGADPSYAGGEQPDYAGADGGEPYAGAGSAEPYAEGGEPYAGAEGGEPYAGAEGGEPSAEGGEPSYAADGAEYAAQPTQGTTAQ